MAFQASGVSGSVVYGYHVVARLSRWTLDAQDQIRAKASDVNTFHLESGGPFTVRLDVGSREWVWQNAQVIQLTGEAVLLIHGSPQVR